MKCLVLVLLILTGCEQDDSNQSSPPVQIKGPKIMALGDSITYGVGWDGGITPDAQGYRGYLSTMLPGYEFVGSQTNGSFYQNHHEGHPGYPIIGQEYDGGWRPGIYENIDAWLASSNPDIILLHIGTNDIAIQANNSTVYQEMLINLNTLLIRIHDVNPNIKIYLAKIIQVDQTKPGPSYAPDLTNFANQITLYNEGMSNLVTNSSWVTIVEMPTLEPADMYDFAHPNPSGYYKMAKAWYDAIIGG